jgi:exonuclease SbcD
MTTVRILHTSDWHVGKVLKGRDRFDEHDAALRSIIQTARSEDADLVLIAGDLFETAAPSPKAQGLVMRALLALRQDGRQVVAIAGNHDNAGLLESVYRPVLGELGLHIVGTPKAPDSGGTAIVGALSAQFTPDSVNIIMAHATVLGGRRGGGERDVQTAFDYEVPASMFPPSAHYAALGHLHRQQEIPAPCPAFYSGAPLPVDFGEEANEPAALIITATPGIRAVARPVLVTGGRRLRTLRGTLDQVIAEGEQSGDAYLRVILDEPARAGLGDLVRGQLPNALEVQLDEAHRPRPGGSSGDRAGRSPLQLFGDYLAEQNVADERIQRLFAELLEEVTGSQASPAGAGIGEA